MFLVVVLCWVRTENPTIWMFLWADGRMKDTKWAQCNTVRTVIILANWPKFRNDSAAWWHMSVVSSSLAWILCQLPRTLTMGYINRDHQFFFQQIKQDAIFSPRSPPFAFISFPSRRKHPRGRCCQHYGNQAHTRPSRRKHPRGHYQHNSSNGQWICFPKRLRTKLTSLRCRVGFHSATDGCFGRENRRLPWFNWRILQATRRIHEKGG